MYTHDHTSIQVVSGLCWYSLGFVMLTTSGAGLRRGPQWPAIFEGGNLLRNKDRTSYLGRRAASRTKPVPDAPQQRLIPETKKVGPRKHFAPP